MSKELELFEEKTLSFAKGLKALKEEKERLEDEEKKLKKAIEDLFNEYDLKSFNNDYFSISRVSESKSISIDLKALEKEENKLYEELVNDYPKVSKRKAYIRISLK